MAKEREGEASASALVRMCFLLTRVDCFAVVTHFAAILCFPQWTLANKPLFRSAPSSSSPLKDLRGCMCRSLFPFCEAFANRSSALQQLRLMSDVCVVLLSPGKRVEKSAPYEVKIHTYMYHLSFNLILF